VLAVWSPKARPLALSLPLLLLCPHQSAAVSLCFAASVLLLSRSLLSLPPPRQAAIADCNVSADRSALHRRLRSRVVQSASCLALLQLRLSHFALLFLGLQSLCLALSSPLSFVPHPVWSAVSAFHHPTLTLSSRLRFGGCSGDSLCCAAWSFIVTASGTVARLQRGAGACSSGTGDGTTTCAELQPCQHVGSFPSVLLRGLRPT